MPDYTPEQVTTALVALVANGGNANKTAEELLDDGFQVPAATLRRWRNDKYAAQYAQLEEQHGAELEREAVQLARIRMRKVDGVLDELIERAAGVPKEQVPQALRAVADVYGKSSQAVLALTGRDRAPDLGAAATMALLDGMRERGIISWNIEPPQPPRQIEAVVTDLETPADPGR